MKRSALFAHTLTKIRKKSFDAYLYAKNIMEIVKTFKEMEHTTWKELKRLRK